MDTTNQEPCSQPSHRPHVLVLGLLSALIVGAVAQCNLTLSERGANDPQTGPKVAAKAADDLNEKRKLSLEEGDAKSLDLLAQASAQTLTVEFTSTKCAVSVYLFKDEDAKDAEGLLTSDPKKALAGANAKAGTIKADVPANTATRVIIRGATAKTDVDLKLTNQSGPNAKDVQIKKLEDENAALKKLLAELKQQLADIKKPTDKK